MDPDGLNRDELLYALCVGDDTLEMMERKAYPSDVSDDEWAFVAPYLTLMS